MSADASTTPSSRLLSSSAPGSNGLKPNVQRSFTSAPDEVNAPQLHWRSQSTTSATNDGIEKHAKSADSEKVATAAGLSHNAIVTLSSPIEQHIVNIVLQMAAIVAAVAFGYYAVQSVQVANRANDEARLANQIAIYALCNSNNGPVSVVLIFLV